ncbi:MAG: chemotaxis protein CheB [Rhodoferax sp.]|jgi:two-component system chemotaxis response regulator CheB|nr:chemotaxis protein CheB [Rhodoferax sp.]
MHRLVAIGLSAGSFALIVRILGALPRSYPLPVVVVAHIPEREDSTLAELLAAHSKLPVGMATDKEIIKGGRVYLAPPGYHLLIEGGPDSALNFSLSVDEPVQSVRPSIDVLFESAAEAVESALIGILLSGANSDGADGMVAVKKYGGLGIVLDPQISEFSCMPEAAIKRCEVDYVVGVDEIVSLLLSVDEK